MKSFASATLLASLAQAKSFTFELEQVPVTYHQRKMLRQDNDVMKIDDLNPEFSSKELEVRQSGYRYQAPMYFGSGKNKGYVSFDVGMSEVTITSDICSNCHSKVYKPGTSTTEDNSGHMYQINVDQGGVDTELKVFSFKDTVCLGDTLCVDEFNFFPMYEQSNLSEHQDGIVGIAPNQPGESTDTSLISALKQAEVIDRAVVGLFISRFSSKPHAIQIGDYDTSYVEGGEKNLHWQPIAPNIDGEYKWEIDLTFAHFGEKQLFKHDFRFVDVNAGYAGMGLTSEDFREVAQDLMVENPNDIFCDDKRCLGTNTCESYKGRIPDLKLTVSNQFIYTVVGDDLLAPRDIIDETGQYLCEILLTDSGDVYRMGSVFLKDYYTVYDIDNYRFALGKVLDFDAAANDVDVEDGDDVDGQPEDHTYDYDTAKKIAFACIAVVFIVGACYIQKRRRDAERRNSGSSQARQQRKKLPLTEEDPNRSLLEAQLKMKEEFKFISNCSEDREVSQRSSEDEEPGEGGRVQDDEEDYDDEQVQPKSMQEIQELLA